MLNQSIGSNKIQIILINDGSIDNSENLSLKYKNTFKNDIIYIRIYHNGVSLARNVGLKYASGKYINFLDSDDKWDTNALKYTELFFKFNKNVDLVSGRIKYFEKSNSYHYLDYKFDKSKIVNLSEEYSHIQLHASSSFFRFSSIKGNEFDVNIFIGEDTKFITNILMFKPLIGFIKDAIYYYRKRSDHTSAMQSKVKNINFFLSQNNSIQEYFIGKSISFYNKIIPFIQFYLAYDIMFRISFPSYRILTPSNYYKYCNLIHNFLNKIDDKYIIEQKISSSKIKMLALSKKYRDLTVAMLNMPL